MSSPFSQNVIAMIWDFDKTLSPDYMQEPLFKKFRVNPQSFWDEVSATVNEQLDAGHNVSTEAIILNQILRYVKNGKFRNLDNNSLRSLGSKIALCKGMEFRKDPEGLRNVQHLT
jgi:hypothetical protein